MFTGINPYTQEILYEKSIDTDVILEQKIQESYQAYLHLKNWSYTQKAQCLIQLATYLEQHKTALATQITHEMGKVYTESVIEVDKCIKTCYWYAEHGAYMLQEKLVHTEARIAKYIYESSGILFAIMPWNFPLWQALRCIIPQIIAGNSVLLKHAPNVLLSAQSIVDAIAHTDLPKGFVQLAFIEVRSCEKIIADKRICGVTLTGSKQAGSSVASLAGKYIKKQVLELGGSDPFLVLEDADISKAALMAVKARFQNAGQTCIAAKRWLVMDKIADEFIAACLSIIKEMKPGNPLDTQVTMGPLARIDIATKLEQQLQDTLQANATLITGGVRNNCLFMPSIVETFSTNVAAMQQETFGPLATIQRVKNIDDLVNIANATQYGLGASIWTKDELFAMQLAKRIEAGNVYINQMVKSHAALPFGGVKESGYGRELSKYGIQEFMNVKSIWVE
jgi:succinate-semialdehyde dehydrogenase / glutarate-semialdehyde dehydrogenase